MAANPEEIIEQTDQMKIRRAPYEPQWQQIRDFVCPMAGQIISKDMPGQNTRQNVLDNTAEQAGDMLAAALVTILTPSIVDWFQLRFEDDGINELDGVAQILEARAKRMMKIFQSPASGFAASQHEKYREAVDFGTGGSVLLRVPGRGYQFSSVPLAELLIAEDAGGFVNRVHRDREYTARQAFGKFGPAAGSKVAEYAQDTKKADTPFRFIHAVYPRREYEPDAADIRKARFASCWVNAEEKHLISEAGFHSMPYQAPRWSKRPGEWYGRGRGAVALPDCKMLQRMSAVTIEGAEKVIKPALLAADDGITSPIRTGAGRITYFRRDNLQGDPLKPLLTGARPDIGEDLMVGVRGRIENAYFKPLIQMIRKDRMTAQEVLTVKEEGERVLGPYLGRLQNEDLGQTIARLYDACERDGVFDDLPLPEDIAQRPIKPEYVSPAVRQQRITQARGLAQLSEITTGLATAKPEILDNLDADAAYRGTADTLGVPQAWMLPKDQVDQIRRARAEAAKQEQDRVALNEALDAGAKAAKAMPAITQSLQSPTEALGV